MTRMKLLLAVLVTVALSVTVPAAYAACPGVTGSPCVHFIGAGSSAMFQGFTLAAYNDLGPAAKAAQGAGSNSYHWTIKTSTSGVFAGLVDHRTPAGGSPPPEELGNLSVVWVTDTSGLASNPTDIWAYLSVDSTVGNRAFLGRTNPGGQPASLLITGAYTSTAGANAVSSTLFSDTSSDTPAATALPTNVQVAISGAAGVPITAGMTDIRPEDAKYATERLDGTVPAAGFPGGGAANPCPPGDTSVIGCSPYFYAFSLAYGPGPIGAPVRSGIGGSTASATPVEFALPGFNDPITGQLVPATIQVFPVGESPIIFIANRKNNGALNVNPGLGSLILNASNCATSGNALGCVSSFGASGYVSDGSYAFRNLWTQHPYSPSAIYASAQYNTVFPSITAPTVGYCVASPTAGVCHVARRALGNMIAGNDVEMDNPSFQWPPDPATEGTRVAAVPLPANGFTLWLREPLSGTYNTTEYDVVRHFGTSAGNQTNFGGIFGKPPYISQEQNVVQPADQALNKIASLKYVCGACGEPADTTEGFRIRGIGTGEVTNGVCTGAGCGGVLNTPDSIAYAFFSFGNVAKFVTNPQFGYLMLDAIDPLFDNYQNAAQDAAGGAVAAGTVVEGEPAGSAGVPATHNPGQPASNLANNQLTWGELPACPAPCNTTTIWGTNPSYPHIRDGSYPAWSELRMECDTALATCSTDPWGAEGLVQHLQNDIHSAANFGVPDLLPFADGGVAAWNVPFGDVGFIRQHFANPTVFVTANDTDEFGNVAPYSNATPASQHQSNIFVTFGGGGTPWAECVAANTPVNGPPHNECGGDVGGVVLPVANVGNPVTQALQ